MPEFIYFDLESARKLLPWLRDKLKRLQDLKAEVDELMDYGDRQQLVQYTAEIKKIIEEITQKGVIIRDIEMGLVDFPAIINDRPAFLCWKIDEDDIYYWHYTEEGFRGRKPIGNGENILSYT